MTNDFAAFGDQLEKEVFMMTGALVHESETCRRILRFGDLVQAPIAKDFGRPSSVIRFRMLHAISASASCDLG